MERRRVFWTVYSPDGVPIRTFVSRIEARKFLNKINAGIPSWHYDELYKLAAEVR